ncbi:MAG: penicillin-insensitive murein endopeptidase [Pseudomonadota bacterium]
MRMLLSSSCSAYFLAAALAVSATAQEVSGAAGAPIPDAKPAEAGERNIPRDRVAAKKLFGAKKAAAQLRPQAIGFYARGCLAGGEQMPIDGESWQAMRLSRNRNWGHPKLVSLLKKFAVEAREKDGWPGLLVGDLSQPRGGPMLTGHRSHQIGLDADIWFTPMPDRRLTRKEREQMSAISMLARGGLSVDPERWSKVRVKLIKRIASYPEVQRVLVHPAIKKALCEGAGELGSDRGWLGKVRPFWGHHYHFHVRIFCPAGSAGCKPQPAIPAGDTCGAELDHWMKLLARPPKPKPVKPKPPEVKVKPKPRREMTLAQLPPECRVVLDAPAKLVVPAPVPAKKP